MHIVAFANGIHTNTLTGGDKIFVEFCKRWILAGHHVVIITNKVGRRYCMRNGIAASHILLWRASWLDRYGVYAAMLGKTVMSFIRGLFLLQKRVDVIFASSFFFPDIIPAFFLKLRHPHAQLAIASYLFTAKRLGSDYSGGRLKGLLFYLNELASFWLTRRYQGLVLTASSHDKTQLARSQRIDPHDIMAIRGAVDTRFFSPQHSETIRYDAVFVGRFHPQKCIDELLSIWQMMIVRHAHRILALVGDGPLRHKLRTFVLRNNLENNVFFLGVHDGEEKLEILRSSRMFVSASRYDSGNIALDEALACGLPGVVYDLPALEYPQGVLKIPVGNKRLFADAIETLLTDEETYNRLSKEARAFAKTLDWDQKAKEVLAFIRR
ncbi:MAG: Glycosyltransferase [Candidatus Gottesmanbacteria bacterium GW2011_GWA2_47_9]|uniref:Glycosyltransferase n=2 Tax=Candidatus Gottesmaniibacteriota TaxID=1752720 RepID=A0A0G1UMU7_9BACT|nr:MAG: Glycosyltransferase [Candidatus Gottesmanbacteria bacterium GW2011_GWA2_47_9]KKU95547.1 MAG: Glycosyltransferase [Candidatus Gottesmanbacteria bacterium GW2011_GWA1_48_13]